MTDYSASRGFMYTSPPTSEETESTKPTADAAETDPESETPAVADD